MRHIPFSTEPLHNPLHNIVVPYKPSKPQLAAIYCLECGAFIRLGVAGESPQKEADSRGGVHGKRWFCRREHMILYAIKNGDTWGHKPVRQRVLEKDISSLLHILKKDYTGGAKP